MQNKYDYEWDHPTLTYHVTKNGVRVPGAEYKANSQFDRSAADSAAKKHAMKLRSDEVLNARKSAEHSYQYDKPLTNLETEWVSLHKKLVAAAKKQGPELDDKELKRYSVLGGSVVRKSILDASHPIMKEEIKMKTFKEYLSEGVNRPSLIEGFIDWALKYLKIEESPEIELSDSLSEVKSRKSMAYYSPTDKYIWVYEGNRVTADILRSLAHEMVHHKQNEEGRLYEGAGKTGTDIENEANSLAGVMLREYGQINQQIYESINN